MPALELLVDLEESGSTTGPASSLGREQHSSAASSGPREAASPAPWPWARLRYLLTTPLDSSGDLLVAPLLEAQYFEMESSLPFPVSLEQKATVVPDKVKEPVGWERFQG